MWGHMTQGCSPKWGRPAHSQQRRFVNANVNALNQRCAVAGWALTLMFCDNNNVCRISTSPCKVKSNSTRKVHVENTQQKFKVKMQQHFGEVKRFVKFAEKCGLSIKHFTTMFPLHQSH